MLMYTNVKHWTYVAAPNRFATEGAHCQNNNYICRIQFDKHTNRMAGNTGTAVRHHYTLSRICIAKQKIINGTRTANDS